MAMLKTERKGNDVTTELGSSSGNASRIRLAGLVEAIKKWGDKAHAPCPPIPVWLPFDDHGEHCQIAIAGVDDAALGALLADVARARAQEPLFSVAYRFAGSRQDVVDVVACLMRVQANRAVCMMVVGMILPCSSICILALISPAPLFIPGMVTSSISLRSTSIDTLLFDCGPRYSSSCEFVRGNWGARSATPMGLTLTGGKELLKERRNVAVGERVGYDGCRLGDDRGGCSNRKSPDSADDGALERFIGVGVVDQISCDA